jgi:hypothetical protein
MMLPPTLLRTVVGGAGRALINRPVWPPAVEIADILSQHMSQMALAEDEHKIQTFGSG